MSDSLDVCDDISSRIDQVKVDNLVSEVGCNSDSLDVCDEISSRTEQNKVYDPIDLGYDNIPCTLECKVFYGDSSVATWPLQDAMRLNIYMVMVANS